MPRVDTEQTIAERMRTDLEAYNAKIDAARQANRERAQARMAEVTREGRSLHQVRRTDLAAIAVAFGMPVGTGTTKTAMVNYIEECQNETVDEG